MLTLVCFHAHPDDEAIATGGTMMKAAAAPQGRQHLCDKEGSGGATMKGAFARQGRQRRRPAEEAAGYRFGSDSTYQSIPKVLVLVNVHVDASSQSSSHIT